MNVGEVLLRRLGVWAVLAALLAGPFGPAAQLHAEANDDPVCADAASDSSDNPAPPKLSAPGSRPGDGHCAICHWLHALRWAALATSSTIADAAAARPFEPEPPSRTTQGLLLQLAARGPPPASTSC